MYANNRIKHHCSRFARTHRARVELQSEEIEFFLGVAADGGVESGDIRGCSFESTIGDGGYQHKSVDISGIWWEYLGYFKYPGYLRYLRHLKYLGYLIYLKYLGYLIPSI